MADQSATRHKHTNRLANETSPYLLQHAHNPVDWYPWGPEAFEAARRQNKPIFLSVGYSTCYWCHVMERQSFENEQIATEMNKRFVNIKVDREERPDVDQLYMLAVQVLTRHGGWPMSVFLRPDLRPFYGGTYFPPTDSGGRAGFLTLLRGIDDAWRNCAAEIDKTATQLTDILQQLAEPQAPESPITINREFVAELVNRSVDDYEPRHGGFGGAPKFPRQTLLEMLLTWLREPSNAPGSDTQLDKRRSEIEQMIRHTLDAMAAGGIRDHLGGGFHRYSTDAQWLVPHFEIMLYDNAMLAWVYAEAYRQTESMRYAHVARGICDFILREMTSPQGAFYTALDAEVDAMEGRSYLWTADEIRQVLGDDDAALFSRAYGIDDGPNFADPHHGDGQPDRNVLYLPKPIAALADELQMPAEQLEQRLAELRQRLYEHRRGRKQPLLDTKIITSWNALMIRALAYCGRVLAEDRYLHAASRAADFLLAHHLTDDGRVWRTSRDGVRKHAGFLDDYAFLAQALLELHDSGGDEKRKDQAGSIVNQVLERFADRHSGGFYFTEASADDLIIRQKIGTDSPLPSGNAVAAMVLASLGQDAPARDTISCFARQLEENAPSMSAMLQAAIVYLRNADSFTVAPGPWRGTSRPPSVQQTAAEVVSLMAAWESPTELHVYVGIREGYHLSARSGENVIATELAVVGESAPHLERVEYPPGDERQFAFDTRPLHVYSGLVTLVVHFKEPMTGKPAVRMGLRYQPCNDQACLPPVIKQFEVNTP